MITYKDFILRKPIRIGTRESQLAVWQATLVQDLLKAQDITAELVYIKSEGDVDLVTPLYQLGVQGIFTKTLDAALLNNRIDIAVHSMKDVPTQLAKGIVQAAVLQRASYKDILVTRPGADVTALAAQHVPGTAAKPFTIGTSSTRRIAQWLNRFPGTAIGNLRGNVNTRLQKLNNSHWDGAIFAAAGLERIGLRPENAIDLDWMLPAPAQGAIVVVCREGEDTLKEELAVMNDIPTAACIRAEKDFLRILMGGCSTPIGALAQIEKDTLRFRGNVLSNDGTQKVEVEKIFAAHEFDIAGETAARELLQKGGDQIIEALRNGR